MPLDRDSQRPERSALVNEVSFTKHLLGANDLMTVTAAIDGMSLASGEGCVTSAPTIIQGSLKHAGLEHKFT